jgi:hypothetical protein
MKIKNLFSGVVTNERADMARALVRQGLAEALEPDTGDEKNAYLPAKCTASKPVVLWDVITRHKATGGGELAIQLVVNGASPLFYLGKPENVNKRQEWEGGGRWLSGLGRECPEEIVKLYKKQWKSNENLRAPVPDRNQPCPENEAEYWSQENLQCSSSSASHETEPARRISSWNTGGEVILPPILFEADGDSSEFLKIVCTHTRSREGRDGFPCYSYAGASQMS